MSLVLTYKKHTLNFKFEAGTSRGVLRTKDCWIIKLSRIADTKTYGLGEVSVIERLSHDYQLDFDAELATLSERVSQETPPAGIEDIGPFVREMVEEEKPALRFALESALLDLHHGGQFKLFDNYFFNEHREIPINGLIWMGDLAFMQKQIDEKIDQGFRCIKVKIGALDFDEEYQLLREIRKRYAPQDLILRVDANGGFSTAEVLKRLDQLAELDLHSIEQPIMPRQPQSMQLICKRTKLPIALDEELISVFGKESRRELLTLIKPQFIVLKPSLLGGFESTREWIDLADEMNIGWWITSALESNVGLNAICQFTAEFSPNSHQGLGTGQLYTNNFHSPLTIHGESIIYHPDVNWDDSFFEGI